ncbi:hypothetical protein [Amaricoccus solimangrovi]|nr:hypothetical protein [Amaricoccus solimangrovi]
MWFSIRRRKPRRGGAIDLMMNRLGLLDIAPDTAPIQFITLTAENVPRA